MSDALLGVLVGGAVAVASALISALVEPSVTAKRERNRARAERLHALLDALPTPSDAWFASILTVANKGGLAPRFVEQQQELMSLLSRLAFATSDRELQRRAVEANALQASASRRAATISVMALAGDAPEDAAYRDLAREASDAHLTIMETMDRAVTLVDPRWTPSLLTRERRVRRRNPSAMPVPPFTDLRMRMEQEHRRTAGGGSSERA